MSSSPTALGPPNNEVGWTHQCVTKAITAVINVINARDEGGVKGFLNKMLGVTTDTQNLIFSHFATELDEIVKKAKQDDKFDEGVVDIRGESISVAAGFPKQLAIDQLSGVQLNQVRLAPAQLSPTEFHSPGKRFPDLRT